MDADDAERLINSHSSEVSSLHIHVADASKSRHQFSLSYLNRWWLIFSVLTLTVTLILYVIVFYPRSLFNYANQGAFPASPKSEGKQVLNLLRQQQFELQYLLNASSSSSNGFFASNNSKKSDVESILSRQILLNKQIQQAIFSFHNADLIKARKDCLKIRGTFTGRRTIEWNPLPNRFLYAICLSGQMSNHLICLSKHTFFAALLKRALIIPSPKFDYDYGKVLDIQHINHCIGNKVVFSHEEFMNLKNGNPHIDRFICYFSLPTACYMDEDHIKKLKGLGISLANIASSPWKEDAGNPSRWTAKELETKFESNESVIAIGDVFFSNVEHDWMTQPGGPIAHSCRSLIEPTKLVLLTAKRFIQTFLGKNFVALHFRRYGFLKFCNAKKPSCFYPVPQAAYCVARVVERANASVVFLATDAPEAETGLLQSLITVDRKIIPLFRRPPHNSAEKWDALLHRHGLGEDSQVEAMLDKTICALSSVFIGAVGSTFTEDIIRLRKDWGIASSCDEYMCQGEVPDYVALDD